MRLFTLLSRSIILTVVTVAAFHAGAQDLHFSQYYTQASTLNPSLVGNYDGSYRLAAIYRNQWASALGRYGFQTIGADIDFSIMEGYLKSNKLAIGIGFFNDRSGTAGLSILNANLSVAYHKAFGKNGEHRLSAGLQGGFVQKRIDDPVFGDQFINHNETPSNSSQENYNHGFYRFDFSAGIYWRSNFKDRIKLGVGAAIYHLITPGQSLVLSQQTATTDDNNVLPRRYVADFNLEVYVGRAKKVSITPEFLFMYQQPATEYLPGVSATYYFNTGFRNNNSVSVGMRARISGSTPDAIVPMAAFEFRNVRLGIAYDLNVSSLHVATTNRGAFELSLMYIGESVKSYKANKSLPSRRF